MTITDNTIRTSTNGDGVTTEFAVGFPFYDAADVVVLLIEADGNEVQQTLTTDYAISGGNGAAGTISMVAPPANGQRLVRFRRSPLTQETDYADGDAFPADSHEAALDRLTMQNQEQADKLARALTLSESTEVSGDLTMEEPVAGRALKWNATEDGIVNTSLDMEATEASVAADAAQTALDRIATAADVVLTHADVVETTQQAGNAAASAALALGASVGKYDNHISLLAADSPYTVASLAADTLLTVDTTGGPVVVNLPPSSGEADHRLVAINKVGAANTVTVNPDGTDTIANASSLILYDDTEWADLYHDLANNDWQVGYLSYTSAGAGLAKTGSTISLKPVVVAAIALGDETTPITAGAAKVSFHAAIAFTLTDVVVGLVTAQTSGSALTFDVNEAGVSILSTPVTIDNTEDTSLTATTPAAISDAAIAAGAKLTVDVDVVGDGTAAGAKLYLIGYPA